jgi:hypothetical protein
VYRGRTNPPTIPDDVPLIELADMVVRGKVKLSPAQQRMLIEMLPFVAPKLTAVAYMREADTFAMRLDTLHRAKQPGEADRTETNFDQLTMRLLAQVAQPNQKYD